SMIWFVNKALRRADLRRPGDSKGMLVTEAMLQAQREIEGGMFKDDPDLQAGLLDTIAGVLTGNGSAADALPLAERALAIREGKYKEDNVDVADSLAILAEAHEALKHLNEAEHFNERALNMRRRLVHGDHYQVVESLTNLGRIRVLLGKKE